MAGIFYTWVVSECPPVCSDTPIYLDSPCAFGHPLMPLYVQTTPICPQCSPVHLHVLGVSACDWEMWGSSCLDSPHVFRYLPMCATSPHNYILLCMPVCSRGYCMCYGGTSEMLGGWGLPAYLSGFWCLSVHALDVHYASSCTFLVVHYV